MLVHACPGLCPCPHEYPVCCQHRSYPRSQGHVLLQCRVPGGPGAWHSRVAAANPTSRAQLMCVRTGQACLAPPPLREDVSVLRRACAGMLVLGCRCSDVCALGRVCLQALCSAKSLLIVCSLECRLLFKHFCVTWCYMMGCLVFSLYIKTLFTVSEMLSGMTIIPEEVTRQMTAPLTRV